jgi:hypothetical protein
MDPALAEILDHFAERGVFPADASDITAPQVFEPDRERSSFGHGVLLKNDALVLLTTRARELSLSELRDLHLRAGIKEPSKTIGRKIYAVEPMRFFDFS